MGLEGLGFSGSGFRVQAKLKDLAFSVQGGSGVGGSSYPKKGDSNGKEYEKRNGTLNPKP